ncbi:hypothetical protein N7463_000174 [Penicillium fimorum]|uniref:Zn(2)-C6 fungal-type domain-containing protein n=1 Tax=Penicillium fimorum TaxID=1882269 RepID=A0A9W9Y3X1_9EURO|nr:hypothetical protein N7463_000174 [Penicillium fimorum]
MKRRQNHSCEQCRKAKKACDGYLQNSGNAVFMEAQLLNSGIQDGLVSPCSYCIKTNKICGLNPHWGQGHRSTDAQGSSHSENLELDEQRRDKRQRIQSPENEIEASITPISMMTCQDSSKETLHVPLSENSVVGWDTLSVPAASLPIGHSNLAGPLAGYENCSHLGDSRQVTGIAVSDNQHVDQLEYNGLDSLMDLEMTGSVSDESHYSDFNSHSLIPDVSQTSLYNPNNPADSISSTWDETGQNEMWRWQKKRKDFSNSQDYFLVPLSLFGASHIAMENSNRLLISESLLRIYHDVLENNLSCWLAEDTCPYKMRQRRHEHLSTHQSQILGGQITPEWGVSWSNRMYRRVKQLDRSAQLTKLIHLTASENRAASKALELSIMTFATQWAQGDAAGMKPSSNNYFDARTKEMESIADLNSTFSRVMKIIDQAGPPVFMERGVRKIHALKHRFKAHQTGFHSSKIEEQVSREFSTEETRTVGLLYWLAIMFDTVSSSMNERPVVVSDEECQHEAAQKAVRNHIQNQISSSRWELDLYAQEDPEKALSLRWPLPYEVMTRTVSRSAAVKVLLFRYISYLQNSLRNSECNQVVEEIIQRTLTVYRYWLKTHGTLFRDLMGHYDSVPPRIKSWFPCIGIPWHLGSLMLADLIEFVDMNRLGCNDPMMERQNTCLVMKIRKESSIDLADLAAVLTPRPLGGMGLNQLPGFHFAVNESPLLTEPWTVLLVRAFSKASIFHLKETEKLQKYQRFVFDHESKALQASVTRLENCVIALRFLGAKSGMAEAISIVLSESLNKCRN